MKMKNTSGEYNDPLLHWKEVEKESPELSALAAEYLTIPATYAPSERVWSQASRVILAKRSRISPKITSHMMFCQENVHLIREHRNKLMDIPMPNNYLPPPIDDKDLDGDTVDVGQHDDD